jgi:NADH-quinone oxidoreductase subunit A
LTCERPFTRSHDAKGAVFAAISWARPVRPAKRRTRRASSFAAIEATRMPQPHSLFETYGSMFLSLLIATLLASLFFVGATLLGPKNPTREKMLPFECGSESSGGRHLKLSVKFYLTAILFVVFDIEAVFIYPWAIQFRTLGWFGLMEMFSFLAVVLVALVYVWKKGALEWES